MRVGRVPLVAGSVGATTVVLSFGLRVTSWAQPGTLSTGAGFTGAVFFVTSGASAGVSAMMSRPILRRSETTFAA